MPIRHLTKGTGITKKPQVGVSAPFGKEEVEAVGRLFCRDFSFDGLVSPLEKWSQDTLGDAKLPTDPGKSYTFGTGGIGTLEHLVDSRGFGRDSNQGYAARLLWKIFMARVRAKEGDVPDAMRYALEVGLLATEAKMKFAWEKPALTGEKFIQGARKGGVARAKGLETDHGLWEAYAAELRKVNPRMKKTAIALRVATKFHANRETVRAALRRMEQRASRIRGKCPPPHQG